MLQAAQEPAEVEQALDATRHRLAGAVRHQADFLAAMSDELRTPLDNVLVLAKLLAENETGNLSAAQVDFAQTIYAAAADLQSLIDDVLDLARMEAEGTAPEFSEQTFREMRVCLLRAFRRGARERRVVFDVSLAHDLPAAMRTDCSRLRHILKTLLSLALKGARGGRLTLDIAAADGKAIFLVRQISEGGIGCRHAEKLSFAICRELAHSLGGEVRTAANGEEFRFALELPLAPMPGDAAAGEAAAVECARSGRGRRRASSAVTLIAEGNAQLASVMLDLVRTNGGDGVVASDLGTLRVLLRDVAPDAILVGSSLLDIDGWSVFDLLQRDPRAHGVPMGVCSFDKRRYLSLQLDRRCNRREGVDNLMARLDAAAGHRARRVLLAGVPPTAPRGADGRELIRVTSGAEALAALRNASFDALAAGPVLDDMAVVDLLREVGRAETRTEDLAVAMIDEAGCAPAVGVLRRRSRFEDILGETARYLGRSLGRHGMAAGSGRETITELAGRKVLVVDDDIYNVYAVTGALERQRMSVVLAESAKEALAALQEHPDVAVVLIDITMPEIDGDGIIHALRATHERALPIIAVTARAMPGDREKCIAAGASDYLAKPVNVAQMIALLRAWLGRLS
jgi:CheY-like chemotaxis protein